MLCRQTIVDKSALVGDFLLWKLEPLSLKTRVHFTITEQGEWSNLTCVFIVVGYGRSTLFQLSRGITLNVMMIQRSSTGHYMWRCKQIVSSGPGWEKEGCLTISCFVKKTNNNNLNKYFLNEQAQLRGVRHGTRDQEMLSRAKRRGKPMFL